MKYIRVELPLPACLQKGALAIIYSGTHRTVHPHEEDILAIIELGPTETKVQIRVRRDKTIGLLIRLENGSLTGARASWQPAHRAPVIWEEM